MDSIIAVYCRDSHGAFKIKICRKQYLLRLPSLDQFERIIYQGAQVRKYVSFSGKACLFYLVWTDLHVPQRHSCYVVGPFALDPS